MWDASPPALEFFDELPSGWRLFIVVVLLAALLGAGIAAVRWVRHWRQESGEASVEEQLEYYRTMLANDEIDAQEFERIRARLRGQDPGPEGGFRAGPPPSGPPS